MKTILVVDDEAKIRDVVASYLTKEGFRTLEAGTGHEALLIVQNETVDFVILDLMLPDMEGEWVCQSIRQINSVPILMLTAKVSENNRIKGEALMNRFGALWVCNKSAKSMIMNIVNAVLKPVYPAC